MEISTIETVSIEEAKKAFLIAITPYGLFGVPRLMTGLDMTNWYGALTLYFLAGPALLWLKPLLQQYAPITVTGMSYACYFCLGSALLMQVVFMIEDVVIFYKASFKE
ncbi:MAG: hypothetical protein V4588_10770 [Pseudomonadota bacterium]